MSPVAHNGEVEIAVETHGDPGDPPLLLVSGFTRQLVGWPAEWIAHLRDGGRFVITYDNRDCGLSSKGSGTPDLSAIGTAVAAGDTARAAELAPYGLADMARDGIAVLDALGVERAHVVGVSMGGMIAQRLAIAHPDRVRTLTSIMSRTGAPGYGDPAPEAAEVFLVPPARSREEAVQRAERTAVWRSRRWPEIDRERALIGRQWDRDHTPGTQTRQFAAILADGSREAGLRELEIPTLVIHGRDDRLIAPDGGERTAAVIPGARLELIADMGHDLPLPLIPTVGDAVLAHTA